MVDVFKRWGGGVVSDSDVFMMNFQDCDELRSP